MFIIVTISLITILTMNQRVEGRDIFVEASVMRPMFKLLPFEATVLSLASVQCLDHPLPTYICCTCAVQLPEGVCQVIIYELAKAKEKWPQLRQHLWRRSCSFSIKLSLPRPPSGFSRHPTPLYSEAQ